MNLHTCATKRKSVVFLLGIAIAFLFVLTNAQAKPSLNPVPYINGLSPMSVVPGGSDFTLTVNGFNFVSSSTVYWGQTALTTTFVNRDQLTAAVPASLIAHGGSGWVTVHSPTPGGGVSNTVFLPVANPTASLTMAQFSYSTGGTGPMALAQGDFDGDGKLDIAASNYNSGNISVFLGNGDGTFQTAVTYPAGNYPWGIAVGDVNNDGKLDLIVGQQYQASSAAVVLLGNGDGTFQAAQSIGSGNNSGNYNPVLVDVNRDGNLDVLIPEYDNQTVALYLGNGDGTFQPRQAVANLNNYEDFVLGVGDFNADGYVDMVVGSWGSNTYVILGNGDGTFQSPQSLTSPGYCWIAVTGDFNNDGKLDFACGNIEGTTNGLYLGNGDGTFQSYLTFGDGFYAYAMTTGDINADGKLDIITQGSSGENGGVNVFLGNGDGTFQAPTSYATSSFSYQVIAGNYATGGGLGIATVDYSSSNLVVILQTVSLSPSSYDFGSIGQGVPSTAQTFTLTNSTSNTVNISGVSFTGANPSDFSQTNDCPESFASGSSCTITVTFTPDTQGSRAATLTVSDDAPGSPQTASLTGTGVISAFAGFSTTSLSFDNQAVGTTSAAQTTTLTNKGTGTLTISSIAVTGTNASDYHESDDCGGSVPSHDSCTISVTFTPAAQGTSSASLVLTDNAADSPQSIALSGTGTQVSASLSTEGLTFGNTPVASTSDPQTVTLTNSGNATLTISSVAVSGTNASDFNLTSKCPTSLAASASCTVWVTFGPAAAGSRTATLTFSDSATPATQSVTLSGTGTQAVASLSTEGLAFGNTPVASTSDPQTITLTNSGNATLTISSIAVSGTNASDFNLTNNCGASLAASASCTLSLAFRPSAAGSRSATITFSDSATPATQSVTLSGTGTQAVASLSTTTLAFANTMVASTSDPQTITLTNSGNVALTISSVAASGTNANDFNLTNNCGTSLAASASCTLSLTFSPSAAGSRSATITFNDSATPATQTVTLTGTGAQAMASLSANSLTFAASPVNTTTAAQTVTLTNSGNATLTISGVALSGANASDFNLTNNCGASLAASASCTLSVTFKPAAAGTRSATITVSDSTGVIPTGATGIRAHDAGSSTQTIDLSGTGQDFTMSTPSGQTVIAGQSASFQLQLAPESGFNQTVTLACTNAPALTTCAVSPASVALGSASSVTVTVTTTGKAIAPISQPGPRFPAWPMTMLCALAAFAMLLMKDRVRQALAMQSGLRLLAGMAMVILLLFASFGLTACNGNSNSSSPRTTAGTYQLTVTATSGSLQHTTTLQMTVQ